MILLFTLLTVTLAQAPSGEIVGVVTDETGAVLRGTQIILTHTQTGRTESLESSDQGSFRASAIPPGEYRVTATATGFQRLKGTVVVLAGQITRLDLVLRVGGIESEIRVVATPQLQRDAHQVSGVVTQSEIERLPLNGRSYLELAKLEPGGQPPTRANNNRVLVPLLGAPVGQNGRATRVTIDGGSVMQVGNGGAALGLSQEVVQEFQVSTVNFDLSTGITASGAVNVITRTGGNAWHGSSFFFFRDHHLSAYPALERNPIAPDPFFQRRQFGVTVGGPLRRERFFIFGSYERNEQRSALPTQLVTPEFAGFSQITPSPATNNQFSVRADALLTKQHTGFIRHSHEGVVTFAPISTANATSARSYPSAWKRQRSWVDQTALGLTSELRADWVNELRFSYIFVSSTERDGEQTDCPGCLGMGGPSINVDPDLLIGNSLTSALLGRRFHVRDVLTWQKGSHSLRFGGDWESALGGRTDSNHQPVTITLYTPQQVRTYNALATTPTALRIPLPSTFTTLRDILQLPVRSFMVGIGDPYVPQKDFSRTRVQPTVHLFFHDNWRLHPRFTVDYGLAWTYDSLRYDLAKPRYLAPLVADLRPTAQDWNNFSPSAGFAWSPGEKTVFRAGAGIYYDFQTPGFADLERLELAPRGVGRGTYRSSGIPSPVDLPGLTVGTLLAALNRSPTLFTGNVLLSQLPAMRATLTQQRGDPQNRDFSITNIEAEKQGTVIGPQSPNPSGVHVSAGVQRELARGVVLGVDFVLRQFRDLGTTPDGNHFFAATGPVLPVCTTAQRNDPAAACSLGPITVVGTGAQATYSGLIVRGERRFSGRWQMLGSYAYSTNVGHTATDAADPLKSYGPLDRDVRHLVSLSGSGRLPFGFEFGSVFTYYSRSPFSARLGGIDLNGDGVTGDPLPGTSINGLNRGTTRSELIRLVDAFNRNKPAIDGVGKPIPAVVLPTRFDLGDDLWTQDLRMSRSFQVGKRTRFTLLGEVFNLFNVANLSGNSTDLNAPGYGQATSRLTQVFGSGGPRAFQIGVRLEF